MPELPEVETTRKAIEPYVLGSLIGHVEVRETRLRWPVVSEDLLACRQRCVVGLWRRGKYLIIDLGLEDYLLVHLGMSGSLRLVAPDEGWRKHDHVAMTFSAGGCSVALRYHDPRRFGCILRGRGIYTQHPLLADLGPEPLSAAFTPEYLYAAAQARAGRPVKSLIMDSHIVVGIGNIYAQESLYHAGIAPNRPSGQLQHFEAVNLVEAIVQQLQAAIAAGGSTLRDFQHGRGEPGYFQWQHKVYGRSGEQCMHCQTVLLTERLAGRTTTWCPVCQF